MAKILIVEDEPAINDLIKQNLALVGHSCSCAYDGCEALEMLSQTAYDLMLLDIMLPKLDGFEIFQKREGVPTIFLTARSGLTDRIKGLNMGADDYITKPFEMLELLARVEAVLRRTGNQHNGFVLGEVQIDFDSRQVSCGGRQVDCTPKEYELLETLVRNRNIALSRDKLLELVWGYDFDGDTRTVDVHIQRLRKKLGWENRICTVYKLGYRLEAR